MSNGGGGTPGQKQPGGNGGGARPAQPGAQALARPGAKPAVRPKPNPLGRRAPTAIGERSRLETAELKAKLPLPKDERDRIVERYGTRLLALTDAELLLAKARQERRLEPSRIAVEGKRFEDISRLKLKLVGDEQVRRQALQQEPLRSFVEATRPLPDRDLGLRIDALELRSRDRACLGEEKKRVQQQLLLLRCERDTRLSRRDLAETEQRAQLSAEAISEERIRIFLADLRKLTSEQMERLDERLVELLEDAAGNPALAAQLDQAKVKLLILKKERGYRLKLDTYKDADFAHKVHRLSTPGIEARLATLTQEVRDHKARLGVDEQLRELEHKRHLLRLELESRPDASEAALASLKAVARPAAPARPRAAGPALPPAAGARPDGRPAAPPGAAPQAALTAGGQPVAARPNGPVPGGPLPPSGTR